MSSHKTVKNVNGNQWQRLSNDGAGNLIRQCELYGPANAKDIHEEIC